MKRSTLFVLTLALAVFLLGSSALMQQDPAPAGNPQLAISDSIPDSYVSNNTWHKLMIGPEDQAVYDSLTEKKAILGEINYGSFRMVAVDERALGGRDAMQALQVAVQDNQNLIFWTRPTPVPPMTRCLRICASRTSPTRSRAASRPPGDSTSCSSPGRFKTRGSTASKPPALRL